jgi:N-acetylglucosaminyl-diphospho-decaprenol L-rhamnosyltransferase
MSDSTIDLSILIVSWNVCDLLIACLESIVASPVVLVSADDAPGAAGLRCEVIVVDSASSDGSAQAVQERFPWVQLVTETENTGFVRGTNRALALARGRHLLLLNPDTLVHCSALGTLVDFLDQHPQAGIAGPQVLNEDGTTQSTRRRFPARLTALFESTWLQGYAPARLMRHYHITDQPDDGTFQVDWVQGCALIARRAVYEEIGGLDPGYVMYSEEMDWCRRAKDAGWHVYYVGDAHITHYGGKSSEQVEAFKHIQFQRSKLRYFRKFHGRGFALALRLFLLLSYAAQIVQESAKAALGSKRNMRRARIVTYLQVLRALVSTGRTTVE